MNLVERAKHIILTPQSEWQVIAPEATTVAGLYRGYILPLAAIGPVAQWLGFSVIGVSLPFAVGTYRVPLLAGLANAVLTYVLGLAGIYLLSLIVDALAPTFGAEKNARQALKVVAYSYTPAWVAAVLHLVPSLGILVLLAALYNLYVLYLGLPVLMKAPREKSLGYVAVTVVCAVLLLVVIGMIAGALSGAGSPYSSIHV